MRQAIHIFAKDVRALWPQILLVLALTAAVPAVEKELVTWALVLARCYLIVCAVHQERLVGDRQWWLTRPYAWKSLLAAKALFLLAFASLPLFIADVVSVKAAGLPLGPAWGNIWMRQIVLAPLWHYGLPAMALAAVTEGLISFALAGLGGVAAMVITAAATDGITRWGLLTWIPLSLAMIVFTFGPAVALVWQYKARRTLAGRAVLCGSLLVCTGIAILPPSAWGIGIQNRMRRAPGEVAGIHLVSTGAYDLNDEGQFEPEVRFDGVPDDMRVELSLFRLQLDAGVTKWDSGWQPRYGVWTPATRGAMISTTIPRTVLEKLQSRDVEMRLSVAFTALGPERTQIADMRHGDVTVDGVGICGLREQAAGIQAMHCRSGAPLEARTWVPIPAPDAGFPMTLEWPIRFSLDASPVWHTSARLPGYFDGQVAFKLRRPVAYLRRDLVLEKIRLTSSR
jgi:hypothetical protein